MSNLAFKAMLLAAKIEQDTARTGFARLQSVLNGIRRLSSESDREIAALADLGSEIAYEFAQEARSASDEYQRLIEREANHG